VVPGGRQALAAKEYARFEMRIDMKRITHLILLAVLLAGSMYIAAQSSPGLNRLVRQVRHELVMLPNYGVFDNLAYKVDGYKVTLLGQVTRPTLKSAAERVVKDIEGVESVDNQIVVLPLSPGDDRLRLALYRAIYSRPGLDRYALMAVPSIHIIVANGDVTLEGSVANEGDKNIANITANGVSGIFSVTNNLVVDK
jgi:hyperosmotically inducible protein